MRLLASLLILLFALSCSTEKISVSPVAGNLSSIRTEGTFKSFPEKFDEKSGRAFYSSELSNQISTFPKFQNSALNQEVATLKFYVKEYVYAVQAYNLVGQENALFKLEKSYKKIQKLRKYLNVQDDEVINRYLVRIKSNIAQLESIKKDSLR